MERPETQGTFYVVKSKVVPILGKDSCVQMELVKILDCDNVNVKETEEVTTWLTGAKLLRCMMPRRVMTGETQ